MVGEEKGFLREEEKPLRGGPGGRKAFTKAIVLLRWHQGSHPGPGALLLTYTLALTAFLLYFLQPTFPIKSVRLIV